MCQYAISMMLFFHNVLKCYACVFSLTLISDIPFRLLILRNFFWHLGEVRAAQTGRIGRLQGWLGHALRT